MIIRKMNRLKKYFSSNSMHLLMGLIIGFALSSQLTTFRYQWKESSFCADNQNNYINDQSFGDKNSIIDDLIETIGRQNENKNLVLIGVMTAHKYLDTRALSIYQTWAKSVNGKIIFFSSSSSRSDYGLPLIPLPTVDDSYPPQKKSFLMLKFMSDHFLDKFEFFMRADDDVYVNTDKLEQFLRTINSSKPQFIGQAGVGNKEEFGQLSLESDENFCMGGPGVIMSRTTLRLFSNYIKYCLKHLYSTHEDVEIGRCVRLSTGIPCTWSYDMQHLFHHNSSAELVYNKGIIRSKEIYRAITIHPIKSPSVMKRLHLYFKNKKHQHIRRQIVDFYQVFYKMSQLLNISTNTAANFNINESIYNYSKSLGQSVSFESISNRDTHIPWDFISHNIYSATNVNPKRHVESHVMQAIDNNIQDIMSTINKDSKLRGRTMEFKNLYYGYMRIDPLVGSEFILDLLMVYKRYRGRKMAIPVRRHAYAIQTFSELKIREIDNIESEQVVNIIVPLSGRIEAFSRFVENFKEVQLIDKYISLSVIFFPDDAQSAKQLTKSKQILNDIAKSDKSIKVGQLGGLFSRAAALQRGATMFGKEALLLFLDVDMHFTDHVINRVRLNTIKANQIYFPIVFSQYSTQFTPNKSSNDLDIFDSRGYWRQFGFGIVSLYNSDLQSVGGFNVSIHGWGMEDVNLYDRIIQSNLTIFRSVDPGLVHIYHDIHCDQSLTSIQYEMCLGTKLTSLGSVQLLAKYINLNKFLKL